MSRRKQGSNKPANASPNAPDLTKIAEEKVSQQILARTTQITYNSVLPPPEIIAGYNNLVENAGERMLVMAENAQRHQEAMDKKALDSQIEMDKKVQEDKSRHEEMVLAAYKSDRFTRHSIGLLAIILMLSISAYAIYLGHPGSAVTIICTGLVSILAIIIKSSSSSDDDSSHNSGKK